MKSRKIFIILCLLSLIISLVCFIISSNVLSKEIIDKYGTFTIYDSYYSRYKNGWLVFLIFVPIDCLLVFFGFRQKDRVIKIITLFTLILTISLSVVHLKNYLNYSTSKEYLIELENKIDYCFENETSILIDTSTSKYYSKSKLIEKVYEGIIRVDCDEIESGKIDSQINWSNNIDQSVLENIPDLFYVQISSSCDKFFVTNDKETLTIFCYSKMDSIIYFIKINL